MNDSPEQGLDEQGSDAANLDLNLWWKRALAVTPDNWSGPDVEIVGALPERKAVVMAVGPKGERVRSEGRRQLGSALEEYASRMIDYRNHEVIRLRRELEQMEGPVGVRPIALGDTAIRSDAPDLEVAGRAFRIRVGLTGGEATSREQILSSEQLNFLLGIADGARVEAIVARYLRERPENGRWEDTNTGSQVL